MDQEDGAMNKHNTASMQNGKKKALIFHFTGKTGRG